MKKIFLASDIALTAHDIAKKVNKKSKFLFITTPIEPIKGELVWYKKQRQAIADAGFAIDDYTFTNKSKSEVLNTLQKYDTLYISGGNVFYLLQKIQESESAGTIRDFVKKGKTYIGTSAGSIIASPDIYPAYREDYANSVKQLNGYDGLNIVDFVVFPHWGSEDAKELYLNHRMRHSYNTHSKIILLTDKQYVEVRDDFYKIIEVE